MLLGMPPTGIEECTLHILRLDNLVNVYVFLHTARYGTTLSRFIPQVAGKGSFFGRLPRSQKYRCMEFGGFDTVQGVIFRRKQSWENSIKRNNNSSSFSGSSGRVSSPSQLASELLDAAGRSQCTTKPISNNINNLLAQNASAGLPKRREEYKQGPPMNRSLKWMPQCDVLRCWPEEMEDGMCFVRATSAFSKNWCTSVSRFWCLHFGTSSMSTGL